MSERMVVLLSRTKVESPEIFQMPRLSARLYHVLLYEEGIAETRCLEGVWTK